MDWDAIGAVAELLGALGVIVSLLYLARQIRQNSKSVNIDSERYLNEAWDAVQEGLGSDKETADIINRGLHSYGALDAAERGVFHARVSRVLNHQYTQRRMQANGEGDDQLVEGIDEVVARILNTPGGQEWWQSVGVGFVHHAEVQAYMAEKGHQLPGLTDLSPWQAD